MTILNKIDKDIKAKWLAALRSGEYRQCRRRLSSGSDGNRSYCCIGVGYVAALDVERQLILHRSDPTGMAVYALGLPPLAAAHLVKMNDECGLDFDKIADWIEENL